MDAGHTHLAVFHRMDCFLVFLIQSERFAFDELVQSSVLPSFISDVIIRLIGKPENRVIVPILDPEASVTYYAVCLKENMKKLHSLF